jgi:hypothetical protein
MENEKLLENSLSIANQITECYNVLPDITLVTSKIGTNKDAAAVTQYEVERLKIATDCVFAALGINRNTSQRM